MRGARGRRELRRHRLWIGRRLAVDRASVDSGYGVGWQWIGRQLAVDRASVGSG